MTEAIETKRAPLEVDLYVCLVCGAVGKIPMDRGSVAFRGYCNGTAADHHKRASMKLRRFREVVDES